jgi:EgtB-related family protein
VEIFGQHLPPAVGGLPVTVIGVRECGADNHHMITLDVLSSFHARHANRSQLAQMLQDARARTLALADAYAEALGESLAVPKLGTLNPPLWELGHIAWFADHWLCPQAEHGFGSVMTYDALYDSSHVPHDIRWNLTLPNLTKTRTLLQASLSGILAKLRVEKSDTDEALYFYRLALFHEDMHAEAAIYSAKSLGIRIPEALLRKPSKTKQPAKSSLFVSAGKWLLGSAHDGFAFDNELSQHEVALSAFEIDSRVVTWAEYLPFVQATGREMPQHVGEPHEAAVHINWFDAKAWCNWAGRRLPSEVEWECAAMTFDSQSKTPFSWGEVWEWTANNFEPYPNFEAHAYKDYSEPWFSSRKVLRGGSVATTERMVHPKYRNFFTPERADIHAGFRSCAI